MNKQQLRQLIKETLIEMGYDTTPAINLVQATIAQESHFGKYIKQIRGPALGIGQMEPNTFNWLMDHYLKNHPHLFNQIKGVCNIEDFNAKTLEYNLKFAICMTRVRYLVDPNPLPEPPNLRALYGYYKRIYNSYKGSATWKQFKKNYKRYVL